MLSCIRRLKTGAVNPIGLRSCNAEGQGCAAALFTNYQRRHGLSIQTVAPHFNTYGPCMHPADDRVTSNFTMQALQRRTGGARWRRLANALNGPTG